MGIAVITCMSTKTECKQIHEGRSKMKKILAITMALVVGVMFVSPVIGYSAPWDRFPGTSRAPVYGGYTGHYAPQPYYPDRHSRSRDSGNDALLVAGVALGGIALGALLGTVISQNQQNTAREVVYSQPAYAQPSGYSTGYSSTSGQWVSVAGQWVNGQWVPAHTVWVPNR